MQDTGYFSLSVSIAPHPHKNTSHYIIEGEVVNWLVEQKKISELFLLALPNFFLLYFSRHYQSSLKSGEQMQHCLVNILKKSF